MKRFLLYLFILLSFSMFFLDDVNAQCAMCKATAESASENIDESIGEGLNNGILYLMGIPYVLILMAVLVFFRKHIKKFYRELAHHH